MVVSPASERDWFCEMSALEELESFRLSATWRKGEPTLGRCALYRSGLYASVDMPAPVGSWRLGDGGEAASCLPGGDSIPAPRDLPGLVWSELGSWRVRLSDTSISIVSSGARPGGAASFSFSLAFSSAGAVRGNDRGLASYMLPRLRRRELRALERGVTRGEDMAGSVVVGVGRTATEMLVEEKSRL